MIPSSRSRVPRHTSRTDQQAFARKLVSSVEYYAVHREEIPQRLKELDEEWDIERAIEMNASALAFAGVAAGALHDRRWLMLPALVTTFLFQHAIQGWCPPVPILRKMGFRTVYEIEQERYALLSLIKKTPSSRLQIVRQHSERAPRKQAQRRHKAA
jgi:hypothetical protein